MARTTLTETKFFDVQVHRDQPVSMSVHIGAGQRGSWVVLLDTEEKDSGSTTKDVPLGQGADLDNAAVFVTTTVFDVQLAHNRLEVEIRFQGAPAQSWPRHHVELEDGVAQFFTHIALKAV